MTENLNAIDGMYEEPFSHYEEGLCPRASYRCYICSKKIEKGTYFVQIGLFNRGFIFHFHQICFVNSPFQDHYEKKFRNNSYQIEDFHKYRLLPPFNEIFTNFNLEQTLSLISQPPPCPWVITEESVTTGGREKYINSPLILLNILIKCGYKADLLSWLKTAPKHVSVLLSMHDDPELQQGASIALEFPDLQKYFNQLAQRRLSLRNILAIAEVGLGNKLFLRALAKAIDIYLLDHPGRLYSMGGFSRFENCKNCQLCYFYIKDANLLRQLSDFLVTRKLPGVKSAIYLRPFYYRASVLYFCFKNMKNEAVEWLDDMEKSVQFFPSGSPKGFINDTKRMALEILK